MSRWLFGGLAEAGLPALCIETRHPKAFPQAQVNTTDRNDAPGAAQMMRVKLFRPVHVKTLASQKRRAPLSARNLLQEKATAIENDIRALSRIFGLKLGIVGSGKFEERIGISAATVRNRALLAARTELRDETRRVNH
ncbi:transposase [Ensifer mexicanus]|nr:transposase [Sinorhizobium mexicanum]